MLPSPSISNINIEGWFSFPHPKVATTSRDNLDRRSQPAAIWKEEDMLEGRKVRAMVAILRTVGCWWSAKGGCLMCGYNAASEEGIGEAELRIQLQQVLQRYEGEEMVKLYTSGSFLDEKEIPASIRNEIIASLPDTRRILFESRPEFVTEEVLDTLPARRVQVALGLESANDEVLRKSIRKGFSVADYERSARSLHSKGIPVRTYLLLKPPYLTESQAIADTLRSIRFASPHSESISVNPLNVQAGTTVEGLWRRGDYRAPWLWSLIEVLVKGKQLTDVRVFSAPSGGGTPRGVHNCDKCDHKVLEAVKKFSFSQDVKEFEGLECGCRKEWESIVRLQDAMDTSVDIERYLGDELELD